MEQNEMITEINKILNEHGIYGDVYHSYKHPDNIMTIRMEGDWKHDHLYAKHILTKFGYYQLHETEIGKSDSDWYTAEHVVMKVLNKC